MAVEGRNPIVAHIKDRANYGFLYEVVGDLRSDDEGTWKMNNVAINESLSAICKGFNGSCALQIIVVPVESDFRAADNTLVQKDFHD